MNQQPEEPFFVQPLAVPAGWWGVYDRDCDIVLHHFEKAIAESEAARWNADAKKRPCRNGSVQIDRRGSMPKTRAGLDAMLDDLQQRLPALLDGTRPEDWLEAFAGEADPIRDAAGPDDLHHVDNRLQCILRDGGLIPGDDEPCSG